MMKMAMPLPTLPMVPMPMPHRRCGSSSLEFFGVPCSRTHSCVPRNNFCVTVAGSLCMHRNEPHRHRHRCDTNADAGSLCTHRNEPHRHRHRCDTNADNDTEANFDNNADGARCKTRDLTPKMTTMPLMLLMPPMPMPTCLVEVLWGSAGNMLCSMTKMTLGTTMLTADDVNIDDVNADVVNADKVVRPGTR